MREPGCQRFDQFHPRDAPRRLPGPPIAGTHPPVPTNPSWFLIPVLFWSHPTLFLPSYSIPHQIGKYIQCFLAFIKLDTAFF